MRNVFAQVTLPPDPDCSFCHGTGIDPSGWGPCACTEDGRGVWRGILFACLASGVAVVLIVVLAVVN